MRSHAIALLLGWSCFACGSGSPLVAPGSNLNVTVTDQAEKRVCQSPVTPEATCTVTMTARITLGELDGRELVLFSVRGVVRDNSTGHDLHAVPSELTSADIQRVAGTNVLPPNGQLVIPLELQFQVRQAPFYVDGPHELVVTVVATASGAASAVT
jgi:hypothetical protein